MPWLSLQPTPVLEGNLQQARREPQQSHPHSSVPVLFATPDMSWGDTGTGAKLVTSTYHISAESCIHPLLAHLCSVLDAFGVLYFLPGFSCPWPKCFVAKTLGFVTSEEGRE